MAIQSVRGDHRNSHCGDAAIYRMYSSSTYSSQYIILTLYTDCNRFSMVLVLVDLKLADCLVIHSHRSWKIAKGVCNRRWFRIIEDHLEWSVEALRCQTLSTKVEDLNEFCPFFDLVAIILRFVTHRRCEIQTLIREQKSARFWSGDFKIWKSKIWE